MATEALEQAAQNPYLVPTLVGIASAAVTGFICYVAGQASKAKESEPLSERERLARIEIERKKAENEVTLAQMKYEEAAREHTRQLEIMARERDDRINDHDRECEREDYLVRTRREHRKVMAKELAELRPALETYLASRERIDREEDVDPDLKKKRAEYREKLVEQLCKEYDALTEGISEGEMDTIDNLVDTKFPLSEAPEMPRELRRLINAVVGEGTVEENDSEED